MFPIFSSLLQQSIWINNIFGDLQTVHHKILLEDHHHHHRNNNPQQHNLLHPLRYLVFGIVSSNDGQRSLWGILRNWKLWIVSVHIGTGNT